MITTAIIATVGFIFLLLPGFAFLRALWGSAHGPIETNNFYHYMTWGSLLSISLYWVAFSCNYGYEAKYIFKWLINDKSATSASEMLSCSYLILPYIVGLTIFSWILGLLIGAILLRAAADFPPLRFKSDWYYYLSGRHSSIRSDFETYIEFMVDGESLVIYRGRVENYRLKDSDSEYVRLVDVARTGIIQWEKLHLKDMNMKDEESINLPSKFHVISEKGFMIFKIADMMNVRVLYQDSQGKSANNTQQQETSAEPLSA
ncbi:hypothetical protein [Fluviicola sp.]|uniref:hypothetical protein n=1 Tax=Fluviicola sp. TaxID=1917219 RepID=UPI003D27F496